MPVDLNQLRERLKNQQTVAVTRNGQLVESIPADIPEQNVVNVERYPVYSTLEEARFGF